MAAVYITTIPCEPYSAHKVQGKPHFSNICPVFTTLRMLGLKVLELLCTFFLNSVLFKFLCTKNMCKFTPRDSPFNFKIDQYHGVLLYMYLNSFISTKRTSKLKLIKIRAN